MKYLLILLVSILIVQDSIAPPVTKDKKDEENVVQEEGELADVMEYHRYLQEVVQALESDPEFRAKLEKTDENEIRSGKIAHELEFVSHNVRTKLDELKRRELERLRHLAVKEYELENGLDTRHIKISEHIDHTNPHTFEIDDLKKLIAKTNKDLDEADKRRKEEFKEYEMQKKFDQEEKAKGMSEEEKKKFEENIHEMEKKHKEHEPLHHPGSKKQLEEVWEKQDHMDQEFDPRTFFFLHDLDGNGVWDQTELKTLFLKELDKLYAEGHPEDDLVERAEELERMREHVIKEADLNKDGFISYEEFINQSKSEQFQEDSGWEPLDQQQIYSEQEYEEYRRQKAREIEKAIAKGMSQEYHPAGQPQAGHQQFPSHPNQVHQDYMHQQAQYQHQVPPHHQQNYPQHGQQGQYGNQMPPQHGQFNQMPPQAGGQMPHHQQQQFHPNQQAPVPNNMNQQHQAQQPMHPNEIPQQQYQQPPHANHIPQHQVPQQQFQQPNGNQAPQQQFQQPHGNQVAQQQFQQPNGNQVPQQQFQQPNGNQVPQQQMNQPPVQNVNQNQDSNNQQHAAATGHNQQNTGNQVPQQSHEQVASINNAQAHQNVPNVAKT